MAKRNKDNQTQPASTAPAEQPVKRTFGGYQPGSGRKSKAEELGLASLMQEAWPHKERVEHIKHVASLITGECVDTKRGVRAKIDPKVQVLALELLLSYGYGKPRQVDVLATFDLNANVDVMTPEERDEYKLKLMQYLAQKGIQA